MSFWIALRYFFSRQIFSLVNVISLITLFSVVFITTSMVLVLSTFNGFSDYHQEINRKSYPDLKIEHINLSTFNTEDLINKLDFFYKDSIITYSEVLEREIIIQYVQKNHDYESKIDKKSYAVIKGVSKDYGRIYPAFNLNTNNQDQINVIESDFNGGFNGFLNNPNLIIVGQNLASRIDLKVYNANNFNQKLRVWYLNNDNNKPQLYFNESLKTTAIFKLGENTIDNIVFADINKIQKIFNLYESSYVELGIKNKSDINKIQNKIQNKIGANYIVKNRMQQSPLIFKIIQTEKLVIYMIFVLIIIITMVTLIGSMLILINQKREDVSILISLGYPIKIVRAIFTYLGIFIVFVGFVLGVFFGYILCLIQKNMGYLKLETTAGITPYPVQINLNDIIIIMFLILSIGFIISVILSRIVFSKK